MRTWPIICASLLLAAAFLTTILAEGGQQESKIDQSLARLMDGQDKIPVIVTLQEREAPDLDNFDLKYRYHLIPAIAGGAPPSVIRRLAMDEAVTGVYLDGTVQMAGPEGASQGNFSLCSAKKVNAEKLWSQGIDGRGTVVAVIDSGIDKNHPDLAGKVVGEKNFVEDEPTTDDLLGHGTMVAGIIAGSGSASRGKYLGTAPGASLLNVKVIDRTGTGQVSDIIAGIEWALDNKADVLSLSLGGMNLGETNPPVTMAADNAVDAGAVVCVAAGNRNNTKGQSFATSSSIQQNFDLDSPGSKLGVSQWKNGFDVLLLLVPVPLPPGLIDSPGDGVKVITVGASDSLDHIAAFSGSGPTRDGRNKPTLVAPGTDVVSTIPPGLEEPDYLDIYYARESGTSLATPAVAGVAALLLQADSNLTPSGVKAVMIKGAKKLNNTLGEEYEDYYQGAGLIDAYRSYQILKKDEPLCAVEPASWKAGRWAYVPAGRGLYVGLNTSADRPQKKLYALAPQDEDYTTRFVFFTNETRKDLETSISGPLAQWMTLQPLPKELPANGHKVFAAALTVPNGTLPGTYQGSIDITEKDQKICSVPVSVEVSEPIEMDGGASTKEGILKKNQWQYFNLDVPVGTEDLSSRLRWNESANLDLFMLAPTSEYYAGKKSGRLEDIEIASPPSGRWLIAIHDRESSGIVHYTFRIERTFLESSPKRWNVGTVIPGTIRTAQFQMENHGLTLTNLSYQGIIENVSRERFQGSVSDKELWEDSFQVPEGIRRMAAKLHKEGTDSELAFLLQDPQGEPVDLSLGYENPEPLEVPQPRPGLWKLWVYGNDVPLGQVQSFTVELTQYSEEPWTWILTEGPKTLEGGSNGTVEAQIEVPEKAPNRRFEGYLDIQSLQRSFQIPVSLTVSGISIEGIKYSEVSDEDKDGYFNSLFIGIGLNVTTPGEGRLEGALYDCNGEKINELSHTDNLKTSKVIRFEVKGSQIWRLGKCGPLMLGELVLYNERGDLIDRYNQTTIINKDPDQFQPPPAYFNGTIKMSSSLGKVNKISFGVGVTVITPGDYEISARLEDDDGVEIDRDSKTMKLGKGNNTVVLEFNPTKFIMMQKNSRLHLLDLTITQKGQELDRIDRAWHSEPMGLNLLSEEISSNG